MTARNWQTRWTTAWIAGLVVGLGFGMTTARGQTQSTRSSHNESHQTSEKHFTPKTSFNLPIQIDPRFLKATKEVVLYSRTPNSPWERKLTVPPGTPHFPFRVVEDGEYWFSVVTVHTSGKSSPADVSREPPALKVVVDTLPPTVQIKQKQLPGGEIGLEATIEDANPNYSSLQLSYRGTDMVWHPLVRVPNYPNLFRLPQTPDNLRQVRYTVRDLAKNVTTQEILLPQMAKKKPSEVQLVKGSVPAPLPDPVPVQAPVSGLPTPGSRVQHYPPTPITQPVSPTPFPANFGEKASLLSAVSVEPTPVLQKPYPENRAPFPNPNGKPTKMTSSPFPAPGIGNPKAESPSPPVSLPTKFTQQKLDNPLPSVPAPVFPQTNSQGRQLINTPLASIQYRIDKVGPSGVSKVDVWIQSTQSNNWQRIASDVDRNSPVEIQLPGDGLFGIRLAVTNGNGFGGRQPQPADPADYWVEVDTTPPVAQIQSIEPLANSGRLAIRWTASDKNLQTNPINLFYSVHPEGPLYPIALRQKNEGQFVWQFPRDVGGQFYVRLEVADEAGNVSRAQPPSPIVLDLTEPRASVVGVNGVNP